jgi:hypothetical protein
VKHLADGTQVQYWMVRHMGVNVILIRDAGGSKEGWYYSDSK